MENLVIKDHHDFVLIEKKQSSESVNSDQTECSSEEEATRSTVSDGGCNKVNAEYLQNGKRGTASAETPSSQQILGGNVDNIAENINESDDSPTHEGRSILSDTRKKSTEDAEECDRQLSHDKTKSEISETSEAEQKILERRQEDLEIQRQIMKLIPMVGNCNLEETLQDTSSEGGEELKRVAESESREEMKGGVENDGEIEKGEEREGETGEDTNDKKNDGDEMKSKVAEDEKGVTGEAEIVGGNKKKDDDVDGIMKQMEMEDGLKSKISEDDKELKIESREENDEVINGKTKEIEESKIEVGIEEKENLEIDEEDSTSITEENDNSDVVSLAHLLLKTIVSSLFEGMWQIFYFGPGELLKL